MFTWKGKKLEVTVYGASHAPEIGVEIKGLPNVGIDEAALDAFLARRRSRGGTSTSRKEPDIPKFVCGVENGRICGDVKAVIYNSDVKSSDYKPLYGRPRPSHADYAAHLADGRLDFTGGGEFSGRMTAPYCIAGGIAKQLLSDRGISVNAYVASVGGVRGRSYTDGALAPNELVTDDVFPSLSNGEAMLERIKEASARGDSVGGTVECVVNGMPGGVGGALFCGLESVISYLVFAIPAVKGVAFGDGFALAGMKGSEANDPLRIENGVVRTLTNRSGGINGGVSNGMPVTLTVAFRPTPSIAVEQDTVDLVEKRNVRISIGGRHDACIVPRAVPAVESAVALAVLDAVLTYEK